MDRADVLVGQITAVRDTGRANMLDVRAVQVIADEMGFAELVCLIEDDSGAYCRFVMSGDRGELS